MTIIGVAGAIGSGKSFTQLKQGLKYCEERQKQLVTNFPINVDALRKYASLPKEYRSFLGYFIYEIRVLFYALRLHLSRVFSFIKKPKKPKLTPHLPWIKWLCEHGGIIQIPAPEYLEALLIPESVVLLDEAGILLNSREFAKTSKQLLADLAQSRKDGCDLIWCAQFDEQVDRQLRMLTQFWIHCESLSVFDKKMRRPKLVYKVIYWFRCSDYQQWKDDPRVRGNPFKTRFAFATITESGFLTECDKYIFNIYDSFKRLDKEYGGALINTMYQCKLPKDYYFERFGSLYISQNDPLSKNYVYDPPKVLKKKSDDRSGEVSSESLDKSSLIKQALDIARKNNIRPPYFKAMKVEDIKGFIFNNK
ncbi:MAG: hypothetical protein AB4372_06400 [Xenococcus sp. (in: cyanobacteria)]